MILKDEFILRRNNLLDKLEDNSVVFLFATCPKRRSADEDFDFAVNRNFLYLTNITQESSVLVLTKIDGITKETLFIHQYDERYEKWIGKRITVSEALEKSGIGNILYLNQFEIEFRNLLNNQDIRNVYIDLEEELKIKKEFSTRNLKNLILKEYPNKEVKNVCPLIFSLRMKKSENEINELKEAIKKTDLGLKKIMKRVKPGLYEYQLQSYFDYFLRDFDNSRPSFPTITSSGVNACCLHYQDATSELVDGDLVLFDLGSLHNYYCADISRTYPVNGKFNSLQKKIYNIVLECNKMIIESARPGITLGELNNLTIEFLGKRCVEERLIRNKEDISKYYYHGVSHFIGLDTHDVSYKENIENYRDIPLEEGNVISNEPGLYFKEYNIGIRIEDDLLITSDGCINLSKDIIKEVEDIENFMKE